MPSADSVMRSPRVGSCANMSFSVAVADLGVMCASKRLPCVVALLCSAGCSHAHPLSCVWRDTEPGDAWRARVWIRYSGWMPRFVEQATAASQRRIVGAGATVHRTGYGSLPRPAASSTSFLRGCRTGSRRASTFLRTRMRTACPRLPCWCGRCRRRAIRT